MNTYLPLWTQSPYINQSRNKHVFNIFVFFRIFYPLTICSHIQPTFFQLLVSNIFPHENSHQMSIHHPHHVHDPRSTARCSVPPSARGRGAGSEEEGTEGVDPRRMAEYLGGRGLSISGWWYTNPSEKWWSSSVGMMTFSIYGKKMFQTTNQGI